jgi:hypothetical protein
MVTQLSEERLPQVRLDRRNTVIVELDERERAIVLVGTLTT